MADDPRTPVPTPAPSARPTLPLIAVALAGAPLSVVTVSLLNRTAFASHPLTVDEAVAFGSVGSAVLGYLFHVLQVLGNRLLEP